MFVLYIDSANSAELEGPSKNLSGPNIIQTSTNIT